MPGDSPLVTVAIPLYRSRRFVETILQNVAEIDTADAEILISDRHGDDDALPVLRAHLAGDPRVRFLEADDRIGWVEHYNFLLRTGRGRYFMWMPHDDTFPAGYVSALAAYLDDHPDCLLAFGDIHRVDLAGAPTPEQPEPAPAYIAERWSQGMAIQLLSDWEPGDAFRGVFRREGVVKRRHWIRASWRNVLADRLWVFGLCLLGPIAHVPGIYCRKRIYPGSTHTAWKLGRRFRVSHARVACSYFWDYAPDRRTALWGSCRILAYHCPRLMGWLWRTLPEPLRRPLRDRVPR